MKTILKLGIAAVLMLASRAHAESFLWVESPGTMVLHDRPAGTVLQISLTGARNEYLSAQLGLRSTEDVTNPYTFEWTSLKGPGGKEIAKSDLVIFRAADIEVNHGSNENKNKDPLRSRPLGMFPDALVPLVMKDGTNVSNSIKFDKDQTQAFWVDVFIPAGTPAGEYVGNITLKTDGKPLVIPVKTTVLNVEIPADSTIPSLYNLRPDSKELVANIESYVSEIMAHRIQPTNYGYLNMNPALRNKYNPDGKGWVTIMVGDTASPTPEREKQITSQLSSLEVDLKAQKLFDHTFLQLRDEPKLDVLPGIIDFAKVLLKDAPDWKGKIADTLSIKEGTELDDMVTAHIRPLRLYASGKYQGRADWDKRRAAGQQLWFYLSNNQGTPFPTFDINTPTVAFEPRVMAWAWWYEKAEGHLYWDLMAKPVWQLNHKYPPGDGQLIYPGDLSLDGAPSWAMVKDIKGPVISRRMKVFRQGLQEWELLKMAEAKVGREKVEPIVSKIYTSMGKEGASYDAAHPMWSYDEAAWDNARSQVLELLR